MSPRWIAAGAIFLLLIHPVAATGRPVVSGWGGSAGASSLSVRTPATPEELQAEVAELQNQVAALQTQVASLQSTVRDLTAGQTTSAAVPPAPPSNSNKPPCPHFHDPTIQYCGCLPC